MKWLKIVFMIFVLLLPILGNSQDARTISLQTSHRVYIGSNFIAKIVFSSPTPLLILQCNIEYNPKVLHAVKIINGGAFQGWGGDVAPWLIKIDNVNGTIKNVFAYSPNGSMQGVFALIEFVGVSPGNSSINITNVIAGDENEIPVPIKISNASVEVVSYPWDVNNDGIVNVLDMIIIAHHWMETPASPHWDPRADVNNDGIVNVLDLILVGQHFGE